MPSGIRTNAGQDTDARYVAGSGGAATGWRVGGADLNARYAPRSSGTIENTGLRTSAGADFDARFQKVSTIPLTAAASPSPAARDDTCVNYRPGPATCPLSKAMTVSTTVSVTGGTGGPYTHSWAQLSGDTMPISDPTAAHPTWSGTVSNGGFLESFWRDTVSDGFTTIFVDVDVELSYEITTSGGVEL